MQSLTLGTTIKRLRMAAGLSQRELAEKLDVAPSYVSHLEANRREPSVQLLRKLATELSVPPGFLLALTLLTEIPEEQREAYREVFERLVELAAATQLRLQLE